MKLLLPLSILIFISSCSSDRDSLGIYTAQQLQLNSSESFGQGQEKIYELKEMVEDKTNSPEFRARVSSLHAYALKMDRGTAELIGRISELKINLFRSLGENINTIDQGGIVIGTEWKTAKIVPLKIDLTKVVSTGLSKSIIIAELDELRSSMIRCRMELCTLIEESHSFREERKTFFFTDPKIESFIDERDLSEKLDEKFKTSKMCFDDRELIKQIYLCLTKPNDLWRSASSDCESWIDQFNFLTSMENDIFRARDHALSAIRYRIGCGADYGFDNFHAIVEGPSAVIAGDTAILKVFIGAYNPYKTPTVDVNGVGEILRIKDGIAYIRMVPRKQGENIVKGTITIFNKSGIPKTMTWDKKVVVLDRE